MADYTKDQIVRESFENYEFDEKQLLVIEYFAENKDEIITKISDNLSET
jgi:DNA-binding winged helix-turn-helix (wHTH) protein